jgi:hypothetical protein
MAANAVYPIDFGTYRKWVRGVSDIEPDVNSQTGEHKTNRDGTPMWRLELLVRRPGTGRSVVDQIKFPSTEALVIDPTAELVIASLVGRHWENENDYGYSSGIALSAESVAFKPTRANGNGRSEDRARATT